MDYYKCKCEAGFAFIFIPYTLRTSAISSVRSHETDLKTSATSKLSIIRLSFKVTLHKARKSGNELCALAISKSNFCTMLFVQIYLLLLISHISSLESIGLHNFCFNGFCQIFNFKSFVTCTGFEKLNLCPVPCNVTPGYV